MASTKAEMTRRSPRRSLPATLAVIASLSGVGFLGVFGGLAYQMAASKDPALGPKACSGSRLHPSLRDIAVPFAMAHQPVWTGVGIIGGWLAAIFTFSFYVRGWIGNKA
jgi:hypothetical protein